MPFLIAWGKQNPIEVVTGLYVLSVFTMYGVADASSSPLVAGLHLMTLIALLLAGRYRRRYHDVSETLQTTKRRYQETMLRSSVPRKHPAAIYVREVPQAEMQVEFKGYLLSLLSNHFPSGLRWEAIDEEPGERACHLYVDLPAHLDLPGHQLRFQLNEYESVMLKKLRAYEKERKAGSMEENMALLAMFVQTEDPMVLPQQAVAPLEGTAESVQDE